jgi:hypothetical protein
LVCFGSFITCREYEERGEHCQTKKTVTNELIQEDWRKEFWPDDSIITPKHFAPGLVSTTEAVQPFSEPLTANSPTGSAAFVADYSHYILSQVVVSLLPETMRRQ